MKLVKFTVGMRHPETGFWETMMPIKPAYKCVTIIYRFLGFPYWRTTKVINEDESNLNARKRAIYHARSYWNCGHRPGVRILKWSKSHRGVDFVTIIWEDGKFLDC